MRLPSDLISFLNSDLRLEYDHERAEPGQLTLLRQRDLQLSGFSVHSRGKEQAFRDPNRKRCGHYLVPAVNLVQSCDAYQPEGILLWVPDEISFGTLLLLSTGHSTAFTADGS